MFINGVYTDTVICYCEKECRILIREPAPEEYHRNGRTHIIINPVMITCTNCEAHIYITVRWTGYPLPPVARVVVAFTGIDWHRAAFIQLLNRRIASIGV